jgi:ketosteroid isomerase-like protein
MLQRFVARSTRPHVAGSRFMNRFPICHRVRRIVTAFAAISIVVALLAALPVPAGDMDASARVLAKLDEDWSAAAAARDLEKVSAFYAEGAIAYPPGQPAAIGRDAARRVWTALLADAGFSLSWKATHAEVAASGDLGYTTGTYEATVSGPDGKPAREKGKYVCIWRKGPDGAWKAIHDIWNADAR